PAFFRACSVDEEAEGAWGAIASCLTSSGSNRLLCTVRFSGCGDVRSVEHPASRMTANSENPILRHIFTSCSSLRVCLSDEEGDEKLQIRLRSFAETRRKGPRIQAAGMLCSRPPFRVPIRKEGCLSARNDSQNTG